MTILSKWMHAKQDQEPDGVKASIVEEADVKASIVKGVGVNASIVEGADVNASIVEGADVNQRSEEVAKVRYALRLAEISDNRRMAVLCGVLTFLIKVLVPVSMFLRRQFGTSDDFREAKALVDLVVAVMIVLYAVTAVRWFRRGIRLFFKYMATVEPVVVASFDTGAARWFRLWIRLFFLYMVMLEPVIVVSLHIADSLGMLEKIKIPDIAVLLAWSFCALLLVMLLMGPVVLKMAFPRWWNKYVTEQDINGVIFLVLELIWYVGVYPLLDRESFAKALGMDE